MIERSWNRTVISGLVLAFLSLNLWYRVATIFDYSRFVGGLFICLGLFSLAVILFPRLLKALLFLFGASFFLFGFRGYDIQSQVFEAVVVVVGLTVFLLNMRGAWGREHGAGGKGQGPGIGDQESDGEGQGVLNLQLVGLMLCYIGLSVLSLQLLPMGHIVKDFWLFGWQSFFLQAANATPDNWLYPLAGINRLLLFFVFAVELAREREARELFRLIFIGIFVGGVFCAFVGLLDYYGVISLTWYRRIVTPGVLHSFFLNRGWFAEFMLTVVPFVMLGFMSKITGIWWKLLLLTTLVVCEMALILAGARAGWVSYPLILFICWLFVYFSKEGRFENFRFGWKDFVKVAVSVPITLGLSFLLIFQVLMPLAGYLNQEAAEKNRTTAQKSAVDIKKSEAYLRDRVGIIFEDSKGGRPYTWREGFYVAREAPVFGMGYETFNQHANILVGVPESHFARFYKAWQVNMIHDTPHNIFFQLLVSGGVVGLAMWLFMMVYVLVLLGVDLKKNKTLLNIPVMISILSFHIYGIFQSMQYIPMIWCLIFLNIGYAMTIHQKMLPEKVRRATGWVIRGMAVLVVIGGVVYFVGRGSQDLADKYGLKVYASDQDWHKYLGFYDREKGPGGYFRWSGKRGLVRIEVGGQSAPQLNTPEETPVQRGRASTRVEYPNEIPDSTGQATQGGQVVEFDVQCHTPGVEKEPVVVGISLDGNPMDEIVFDRKRSEKRWYYLGAGGKEQGAGRGGKHEFLFNVSRTWNPKRMEVSEDVRDLGVMVSEPKVLTELPKEGVGFYHWEKLDDASAKSMGQGAVSGEQGARGTGEAGLRFRWTGRRASIPVGQGVLDRERGAGGKEVMFLRCGHPNIGKEPVVVQVWGDSVLLRQVEFRNNDWREMVFDGKELEEVDVVTFEASRTWNPKRIGMSEDNRDLGVAVVIP